MASGKTHQSPHAHFFTWNNRAVKCALQFTDASKHDLMWFASHRYHVQCVPGRGCFNTSSTGHDNVLLTTLTCLFHIRTTGLDVNTIQDCMFQTPGKDCLFQQQGCCSLRKELQYIACPTNIWGKCFKLSIIMCIPRNRQNSKSVHTGSC